MSENGQRTPEMDTRRGGILFCFQSKLLIINNLHDTKLLVHGLHNEWRPNFCLR